jgi:hypothetical protein
MKRIMSIASLVALVAGVACKHKDNAPPAAASVSAVAPLASAAVLPGVDKAVGDFEGEIGLLAKGKLTENGAPLALTLRIKSGNARIDVPESLTKARGFGPVYLLVRPADKKAYAILEARKQAVLFDMEKLAEQAKGFSARVRPDAATAPKATSLEKTGKVATVAGIKCEIWHFNQGKTAGDACIAEQETSWLHFPSGAAPAELAWLTPVADGKHFPLRFVATEQDVERGRVEVTSIEHKALAASLFELPVDYTVLGIEQMMASMLGGLGGPGMPPGLKLPPGTKLPPGLKLPATAAAPPKK